MGTHPDFYPLFFIGVGAWSLWSGLRVKDNYRPDLRSSVVRDGKYLLIFSGIGGIVLGIILLFRSGT
jgi:hypothetical protein